MTRNTQPGEFNVRHEDEEQFKEIAASNSALTKNKAARRKLMKTTEAVGVDAIYEKWNGKARASTGEIEFETVEAEDIEPRELEGLDENTVYDKWNGQMKAPRE